MSFLGIELLVVDIGWMDGLRLEEGSGEGFCQRGSELCR
jgi:hypothetical protein